MVVDAPDWVNSQSAVSQRIPLTPATVINRGQLTSAVDITQYASIVVQLSNPSSAASVHVTIIQYDETLNVIREDRIGMYTDLDGNPYTITVPVVGKVANVYNFSGGAAVTVAMWGTNRVVTRALQGQFSGPVQFLYSGTIPVGSKVLMNVNVNLGDTTTGFCCDYPVALQLFASAATSSPNGVIAGMRFMQRNGIVVDLMDAALYNNAPAAPAGTASWAYDSNGLTIPLGVCVPILWNTATTAILASYVLDVIPRVAA
jgi:hypothetical protein